MVSSEEMVPEDPEVQEMVLFVEDPEVQEAALFVNDLETRTSDLAFSEDVVYP